MISLSLCIFSGAKIIGKSQKWYRFLNKSLQIFPGCWLSPLNDIIQDKHPFFPYCVPRTVPKNFISLQGFSYAAHIRGQKIACRSSVLEDVSQHPCLNSLEASNPPAQLRQSKPLQALPQVSWRTKVPPWRTTALAN